MIIHVKSMVVISLLDIKTMKNNQDKRKIKMYFKGRKIYMYIINFVGELYFTIAFIV